MQKFPPKIGTEGKARTYIELYPKVTSEGKKLEVPIFQKRKIKWWDIVNRFRYWIDPDRDKRRYVEVLKIWVDNAFPIQTLAKESVKKQVVENVNQFIELSGENSSDAIKALLILEAVKAQMLIYEKMENFLQVKEKLTKNFEVGGYGDNMTQEIAKAFGLDANNLGDAWKEKLSKKYSELNDEDKEVLKDILALRVYRQLSDSLSKQEPPIELGDLSQIQVLFIEVPKILKENFEKLNKASWGENKPEFMSRSVEVKEAPKKESVSQTLKAASEQEAEENRAKAEALFEELTKDFKENDGRYWNAFIAKIENKNAKEEFLKIAVLGKDVAERNFVQLIHTPFVKFKQHQEAVERAKELEAEDVERAKKKTAKRITEGKKAAEHARRFEEMQEVAHKTVPQLLGKSYEKWKAEYEAVKDDYEILELRCRNHNRMNPDDTISPLELDFGGGFDRWVYKLGSQEYDAGQAHNQSTPQAREEGAIKYTLADYRKQIAQFEKSHRLSKK